MDLYFIDKITDFVIGKHFEEYGSFNGKYLKIQNNFRCMS